MDLYYLQILEDLAKERDRKLEDLRFVEVSKRCRLYYALLGEGMGFDFVCIEITSYGLEDQPFSDSSQGYRLFTGWAAFDGVRHIVYGEEGYFNYPDFPLLVSALVELQKLILAHCPESDQCRSLSLIATHERD